MLSEPSSSFDRARRLASSLGLALLVLSPLVFARALEDAYLLPQRLVALLGLLIAWLALGRAPLNRSTLFFMAIAFFLWRSIAQSLSARASENLFWFVAQLPSVGALCLAAHAGRDRAWAARAWRFGGLSAVLVALYALILLWGLDPLEQGAVGMGFLQKAHGSLGNPDFLAGFLVLVLPALTLAWLVPSRRDALHFTVWLVVLLALLFTHVRAGWLAAGLSLLVTLLAARDFIAWRRVVILGAVLLGLLLALSVPSRFNVPGQSPWARVSSTFSGDGSWAGRRFMASVAWQVAREHPWTGTGPGRFQEAYLIEQGHQLSMTEHSAEPYRFTADIHNDWLQTLAETGWPGLFLLGAVFFLALRGALQLRSLQGAALIGLFVAFGVHALFHFPSNIQASSLFFWGAVGLLAAQVDDTPSGKAWPWVLWALPLSLGLVLTFQQVLASAALNTGTVLKGQGRAETAEAFFKRATQLWPQDVRAWMRLGIAQDAQGKSEASITSFATATEVSPGLPEAWSNLGLALGKAGELEPAQAAEEQALSLNPRSAETWANLAKIRDLHGDRTGALRDLDAGLAQAGPNATLYFSRGALQLNAGHRLEARAAFERCLQLDPGNRVAAEQLKGLGRAR